MCYCSTFFLINNITRWLSIYDCKFLSSLFSRFEIDKEKLFADIHGVLDSAMSWEKRAMDFLAHGAQLYDFEEIIRFPVFL